MLTYPVHLMWSNFSPNSSDKEVVMSAPPWMLTKHRLPSPSQASAASSPPVPLPPPPPPPPVSLPTPPTVPPPPTLPLPSPPRTKSRVSDVLDLIGLVLSGFFLTKYSAFSYLVDFTNTHIVLLVLGPSLVTIGMTEFSGLSATPSQTSHQHCTSLPESCEFTNKQNFQHCHNPIITGHFLRLSLYPSPRSRRCQRISPWRS